jgi:hypothetical protein
MSESRLHVGAMSQLALALCVLAAAPAVPACSSLGQRLQPAPDAHAVAGMDRAAVDADHQIEVIAQTSAWPGDARIMRHIEPIRVRIGNYGTGPVHLRYDHFRLVTPDGRSFALLPPLPTRSGVPASARRIITPRFKYAKYRVAPYYGAVYTAIAVHDGDFLRRDAVARDRVRFRQLGSLPTPEMVDWAIPEGVLEVSGFVDGYLFFERVPKTEQRVELQIVLRGLHASAPKPSAGVMSDFAKATPEYETTAIDTIARVSIPFVVN